MVSAYSTTKLTDFAADVGVDVLPALKYSLRLPAVLIVWVNVHVLTFPLTVLTEVRECRHSGNRYHRKQDRQQSFC